MTNDENFLKRCLELSMIAQDSGDAAVGSLIVINEKIIAEGIESVKSIYDPTAHAEIIAVKNACEKLQTLDLSGAVLYTNVEPCVMCAFAIRQTGISTVVFTSPNSQVGGANSIFKVLTDPKFPAKFAPPQIRKIIPPGEV